MRLRIPVSCVSEYLVGDIAVDISEGYFYASSMRRPISTDSSDQSGIYRAKIDGSNLSPVVLMSDGENFIFSLSYNWAAGIVQ
jgi:hypothetical protein